MADPKKMSVADILAAARKKGGSGAAAADAPPESSPAEASPSPAPVESTPVTASVESPVPVAEKSIPTKPAAPAKPAGKMTVAEMLAAARAKPGASAPAAASTPAAVAPALASAPAPEIPKPAPAAKPSPIGAKSTAADKPAEVAAAPGVKDTASILAAARTANKLGPMSKEEAKASGKEIKVASSKTTVPPMPQKPAWAKPPEPKGKAVDEERRGVMQILFGSFLAFGFTSLSATFSLWTLGFARFMFPNILTEPPSRFKVGFPSDFPPGKVEEKFKALFGVWIVNAEYGGQREIVALRTVCTHLGCTPNWLEGEQKFKCPCHGSGFYKDGINFEGPAPRPLERYAIRIADDGQIEVDKSTLFQEELGQWVDPASYVTV